METLQHPLPSSYPLLAELRSTAKNFDPFLGTLSSESTREQTKDLTYWQDLVQTNEGKWQTWKNNFPLDEWPLLPAQRKRLGEQIRHAQGQKKRIVLELGCGNAWFSNLYTLFDSSVFSLGVDRSAARLEVGFQLRSQLRTEESCCLVQSDHLPFLSFVMPEESADVVALFYPNPYPKNTQASKRFHLGLEFHRCLRVLKNGGHFLMTTTEADQVAEVEKILAASDFRCTVTRFSQEQLGDLLPRSAFEHKYLEQGKTLFQVSFQKVLPKPS